MARTTLLDVFQGGTQLATGVMGVLAGEEKEKNDVFLRNIQAKLAEMRQRYLNDIKNGKVVANDADDYNPGWDAVSQGYLREVMGQASNRYTRQNIEYMFSSGDAQMRPLLENASREKVIEKNMALRADTTGMAVNSSAPVPEKIRLVGEEWGGAFLHGEIGPAEYIKAETNGFKAILYNDIQQRIDKALFEEGRDLDYALNELLPAWERDTASVQGLEVWDAEGQWETGGKRPTEGYTRKKLDTTGLVSGVMDGARNHAKEQWNVYIEQKQTENDKLVSEWYANAVTAWLAHGDKSKALALAKQGLFNTGQFKGPWMKESDFNSHTKDWAALIKALTEDDGSGSSAASDTMIRKLITNNRYESLQMIKKYGESSRFYKIFVDDITRLFTENSIDPEKGFRDYSETLQLDNFFSDVKKVLLDENNDFQVGAIEPLKAFITDVGKKKNLSEETKTRLFHQISKEMVGVVHDSGMIYSPGEFLDRAKKMVTNAVEGGVLLMSVVDDSPYQNMESKKGQIRFLQDAAAHPEAVTQNPVASDMTAESGISYIGNSDRYLRARAQFQKDLPIILKLGPESRIEADWSPEGDSDITAVPEFTVSNSGDKNGRYMFTTDGKDVILKKYNTETKDWVTASNRTAGEVDKADSERLGESTQSRTSSREVERLITAYNDMRSGKIQMTEDGRNIESIENTLRNTSDISFYENGYDPKTYKPIRVIPREVVENIKKSITESRYREINAAWRRKGIRIE